jgi:hypothetical protein
MSRSKSFVLHTLTIDLCLSQRKGPLRKSLLFLWRPDVCWNLSSFKIPFIQTRLVIHPVAYGITKALRNAIHFQRRRYLCMRLAVCWMTSWESRYNLACPEARVWRSENDLKIYNRRVLYGSYATKFRRNWQVIWLRAQGGMRMLW